MINALTTNLTSFFREAHHFEHLRAVALPEIARAAVEHNRRLRLWSSACSSGEEPYSMAISLLASGVDLGGWDVRILASDLDTNMLARAQEGQYKGEALRSVPAEQRARYFERVREADDRFGVKPAVRRLITFKQLNLLEAWPMRGPFDVIFCRNVLIYFDAPTKARLVQRFVEILRPSGWLYLGHSESLLGGPAELEAVGRTTYRRTA
jgi:chemotaxis protein methyltransferase CheR